MSKLKITLTNSDSDANTRRLISFGPHSSLPDFLSNLATSTSADVTVQLLNSDDVAASATVTMDFSLQTAGDTIQIGALLLEADDDFDIGADDTESAANLSAAINAGGSGLLGATSSGAVVTVTATSTGPLGNAIPIILTQTTAGMAAAAALSGGSSETAPASNWKSF